MTLTRLVTVVRGGLLVLGVALALGLLAGVAFTARANEVYAATARVYVTPISDGAAGVDLNTAQLYAHDQVKSLAVVARSSAVLGGVIDDLDLDTEVADLAARVSVVVPLDTVVIEVTVEDGDPEQAAALANAIAAELGVVGPSLAIPGSDAPTEGDGVDDDTSSAPTGTPTIRLTTIQRATPPTAPISPRPVLNVGAGAVTGLGLGIAILVARELLRRRITSVAEIEEATGLPVVGMMPYHGMLESNPGAALDATRLVWASMLGAIGPAPRSFLLVSIAETPGVPKLAGRLAPVIAETDRPVIWVDADVRGGRVTAALDVSAQLGLSDLARGRTELDQVVTSWRGSTLSVIGSGTRWPDAAAQIFSGPDLADAFEDLARGFETVVIDGSGLTSVPELVLLAQHVSAVLVVATPTMSRSALTSVVDEMRAAGLRVAGVVVDEVPPRDRADFERRLGTGNDVIED